MKNQNSEKCLEKLEELKKKIQKIMQIREDATSFNQYRVNFEITQPSNLVGGTLQQHQLQSLEWMINLAAQQSNGILADDMGLGKTIQAISYLAYLKQQSGIRGKHLIICPKSVSNNWIKELKKWLPSSRAVLLLNREQEREKCLKQIVKPMKFDILVTTYEGAKRCILQLEKIKWQVLVVDEAHKIKNFQSQNFAALNCYKATFKLLLSGTPLSNNLQQLWVLLYFIMPDLFNNSSLFNEIEQSVQLFEGTQQQKLHFRMKIAKYFHSIINPFFKRRAKKDLQLGLPPKIQKTLYVPLSPMQLQMYKNYLRYGNVYGDGYGQNRHMMIARKICLHPYLFDDMWPQDQQYFGQHAIQNCGKLKVLDKLLKKLLNEKHKVLIFSQFTILLDILQDYCNYRGFKYCRLDGSTEIEERDEYMSDFNNTQKYQIFLLSTKAGGLGINLTGADRVIIYDIDWNPQNDIQAMDRAYRMGQTKAVHVYKMITQFTIEERIAQFQKYKLIWDELVIQKGAFMSKKHKDDPFKNVNLQTLDTIGKGEIFRLNVNQNQQNIQEIQRMGVEKDKKISQIIKNKLKNIQANNFDKINPFQDTNQFIPEPTYDQMTFKRRNYEFEKRQKAKFDRNHKIPAFKFYIKTQKIRDIEFQIHMQLKRQQDQQNKKLLNHLQQQLEQLYNYEKFHKWSQQEFDAFIGAHQLHLKQDYHNIALVIGTKDQSQVQCYSRVFFEKAPNNQKLTLELQNVMVGQKLAKLRTLNQTKKESEIIESSLSKQQSTQYHQILPRQLVFQQLKKKKQAEQQESKKQRQRLKQEARQKKEQEKKRKAQDQKARKEQREKREKLKQQRLQQRLQKQEEKRLKAERWQKLLQQRKEKKQKQYEEKLARIRQLQKKKLAKIEEMEIKKRKSQQKRLQQQSFKILKKVEKISRSSQRNSSVSSRSTEKRGQRYETSKMSEIQTKSLKHNPLQIAIAKRINSIVSIESL